MISIAAAADLIEHTCLITNFGDASGHEPSRCGEPSRAGDPDALVDGFEQETVAKPIWQRDCGPDILRVRARLAFASSSAQIPISLRTH
jgi:hypothetical protein